MHVLFLKLIMNDIAMIKENRYEQMLDIIGPYLPEDVNINDVTPASHFVNELNINSAHLVDIILDVEDKYDIVLENEDMDSMQTVQQAIELIDNKLADK